MVFAIFPIYWPIIIDITYIFFSVALQNQQYSRPTNGTGHEHPISPSFNLPEQFNGMQLLNSPLPFPNRPPFITPSITPWSQYSYQYQPTLMLPRYGSYQYLDQMENGHRHVSNESPAYRIEQFENKPKMWHPWLNCNQKAGTNEYKDNGTMISSPTVFEQNESLSGVQLNTAEYFRDLEHKRTQPTNKKFKKSNNDKVPRPMNSFMLFAKRNRGQIHLVFPQCDNRAVSKILSETWYSLDPRIRKPYVDLANDMKNKHFQLYPEFKWKAKHNMEAMSAGEILDTQDSPEPNISHEEDVTNHGIFQLAPTPAQLGIRRKQALADVPTNTDSLKPSKEQYESRFEQIDIEKNNSLIDLYFQESFKTLPLIDFSNYKSQGQNNLSPKFLNSTVQYESSKKRFGTTKRVTKAKLSKQMSKSLVGSRFFGPDFNIDNIKGM